MTKADLIQRAGRLLYPQGWNAGLAALLEVSPRRLRRMVAGDEEVPAGLLHDVEMALRDHGNALDELLAEFP